MSDLFYVRKLFIEFIIRIPDKENDFGSENKVKYICFRGKKYLKYHFPFY